MERFHDSRRSIKPNGIGNFVPTASARFQAGNDLMDDWIEQVDPQRLLIDGLLGFFHEVHHTTPGINKATPNWLGLSTGVSKRMA